MKTVTLVIIRKLYLVIKISDRMMSRVFLYTGEVISHNFETTFSMLKSSDWSTSRIKDITQLKWCNKNRPK